VTLEQLILLRDALKFYLQHTQSFFDDEKVLYMQETLLNLELKIEKEEANEF